MNRGLDTVSVGRAHDVRAFLRSRRRRFRPTAYQVYATLVFVGVFGALLHGVIVSAIGGRLTAHKLIVLGPVVLMLVALAAARFGTWQGPVTFSTADAALLLSAPIAIAALVRPKLDRALLVAAVGGTVAAGLALLLLAGGPAGVGAPRSLLAIVGGAAFALCVTASSWLIQSSRSAARLVLRASAMAVVSGGALLVAAATGSPARLAGSWSGPWGWVLAPLVGTAGWPVAAALMVGLAVAVVVIARSRAGSAPVEEFLSRAETRAGLAASTFSLEYRSALQTYREALTGQLRAPQSRLARPGNARLTIIWRDALALLRDRGRIGWSVLFAASGTYELLSHPVAAIPAALGAIGLYFGASVLCEPLRLDVDRPDRSTILLGWGPARLLIAHCMLPAGIVFIAAAATIVASTVAGVVGAGASGLIPTILIPVTCTTVASVALASRRGGRIDERVLSQLMTTDVSNPFGIALIALWLAPWLLLQVATVAGDGAHSGYRRPPPPSATVSRDHRAGDRRRRVCHPPGNRTSNALSRAQHVSRRLNRVPARAARRGPRPTFRTLGLSEEPAARPLLFMRPRARSGRRRGDQRRPCSCAATGLSAETGRAPHLAKGAHLRAGDGPDAVTVATAALLWRACKIRRSACWCADPRRLASARPVAPPG